VTTLTARDAAARDALGRCTAADRRALSSAQPAGSTDELSATSADTRHLHWLREQLGDRFAGGIALDSRRAAYPLGERITAVPITTLWV